MEAKGPKRPEGDVTGRLGAPESAATGVLGAGPEGDVTGRLGAPESAAMGVLGAGAVVTGGTVAGAGTSREGASWAKGVGAVLGNDVGGSLVEEPPPVGWCPSGAGTLTAVGSDVVAGCTTEEAATTEFKGAVEGSVSVARGTTGAGSVT